MTDTEPIEGIMIDQTDVRALVAIHAADLMSEGTTRYVVAVEPPKNSSSPTRIRYRFPNGYGASVIRGPYTYGGPEGLFEIGVLQFIDDDDWTLTYDTPITNDVIGHLAPREVDETLLAIRNLPMAAVMPEVRA